MDSTKALLVNLRAVFDSDDVALKNIMLRHAHDVIAALSAQGEAAQPAAEKSASDAPCWYNLVEAEAWASGYNTALLAASPNAASRERERALERERDEWRKKAGKLHDYANMRDVQVVAAEAEVKRLREALEPFAKVGRIIDELFGPALFSDDDDAFTTGCEWFVNGKRETLKWGDFRRALADANTQGGDNAAD